MNADRRAAELEVACYSQPATIETADIHAVITEEDNELHVCLRGTDPTKLEDIVLDIGAVHLRCDPILKYTPHTFLSDAEQLAWRLQPYLRSAGFVGMPWHLYGHSKGAAEAQALAAIATYGGWPPKRLVTWAAPEMGRLSDLIRTLPGSDYAIDEDRVPSSLARLLSTTPRQRVPLLWAPAPKTFNWVTYHRMESYLERMPTT